MAQWSLLCFEKELKKNGKGVEKRKVVPLLVFACEKNCFEFAFAFAFACLGVGWGGGNV